MGPHGPQPLGWSDVDAWARRTKRDPSPWECHVIQRLDDAFFFAQQGPAETAVPVAADEPAWPTKKVS